MKEEELQQLASEVHTFVAVREWCLGHNPKNLAMAISVEAGELSEIFQWLTPEEAAGVRDDPDLSESAAEEIGDVFILLLSLCNALSLRPAEVIRQKMAKNALKYPASEYTGKTSVRRPAGVEYTCPACASRATQERRTGSSGG